MKFLKFWLLDTCTICSKPEERGRLVEVRDSFLEEDLKKYRE